LSRPAVNVGPVIFEPPHPAMVMSGECVPDNGSADRVTGYHPKALITRVFILYATSYMLP
jgi:hypothetical protein